MVSKKFPGWHVCTCTYGDVNATGRWNFEYTTASQETLHRSCNLMQLRNVSTSLAQRSKERYDVTRLFRA